MPGSLIISLDLELYWGVQDEFSLEFYGENLRNVRQAVSALLALFDEFQIHATWATVGLLACEGYDDALHAAPQLRPSYQRNSLDPYRLLERSADPLFYFTPSLLREIAAHPGQEIATHTFSHYYCLEAGQTLEQFRADLRASLSVLSRYGPRPQSIVFPRNQYSSEYLEVCRQEGIRFFRGNAHSVFYDPHRSTDESVLRRLGRFADAHFPLVALPSIESRARLVQGMLDVSSSRFLRPTSGGDVFAPLRQRRILQEMKGAASRGNSYHLWWHPHNTAGDIDANLAYLRAVFEAFARLRQAGKMRSLNMQERGSMALEHGA